MDRQDVFQNDYLQKTAYQSSVNRAFARRMELMLIVINYSLTGAALTLDTKWALVMAVSELVFAAASSKMEIPQNVCKREQDRFVSQRWPQLKAQWPAALDHMANVQGAVVQKIFRASGTDVPEEALARALLARSEEALARRPAPVATMPSYLRKELRAAAFAAAIRVSPLGTILGLSRPGDRRGPRSQKVGPKL